MARQCTATLAKAASCRVAVTLQFAAAAHVVGLDAQLYLPEVWTGDRERWTEAGVPESAGYRPTWQLAVAVPRRAHANGLRGVVPADSLFGTVAEFRKQLGRDGRPSRVAIGSSLKVIAADADLGPIPPHSGPGRPPTRPVKVRGDVAERERVGRRPRE